MACEICGLAAHSDVSGHLITNSNHFFPSRQIDENVSLSSNNSIGLGIKKHHAVDYHRIIIDPRLGEKRAGSLRAIQLSRELRIELRTGYAGSFHREITWFRTDPGRILPPVAPRVFLGNLDLV